MTLFPPWKVRERKLLSETFGPERAGELAFILAPPHETNGRYVTMIANLDGQRLFFQYVALGLLTGGILVLRSSIKTRPVDRPSSNAGWFEQHCPTFSRLVTQESKPTGVIQQDDKVAGSTAATAGSPQQHNRPTKPTEFVTSPFWLLTAVAVAAVNVSLLPQSLSRAAMAGAFAGGVALYFGVPVFLSYIAWKIRPSKRCATFAFFASIAALLVLMKIGEARLTAVAAERTAPTTVTASAPAGGMAKPAPALTPQQHKKLAELTEAYLAGTMPENQRHIYEEAIRRGLVPSPTNDSAIHSNAAR